MALAAVLLAAMLPLAPQPRPPFPKIVTDAVTVQDVAPGVQYGEYSMLTQDGPLSVHVVAVDLHEPTVRVGSVLAQERLVSAGETVSSMAHRTGAVAGINGDYFDINQTNQPLNILIENSRLVRAPMQRWAVAFTQDKQIAFNEFHFDATATLPSGSLQLKTMNDWPPPGGGAVLITPEYGQLRPAQNVTEAALQLTGGTPPFATYRVTSIADNSIAQPAGYYLAIGVNEYGQADPPNPGDAITIAGTSTPSLDGIATAIGGGPLLVKDGAWYPDPDGPSTGEFATHMPATGIAATADGTLLLFEIDGRQPATSIGVLQPQLASLMIAFGAQNGMQFDGGGSSTVVARLPGDIDPVVQNSPSDGKERRVGDGFFVYSDAPRGAPARLYATPGEIRALPGARVPLRAAVTDEGGHVADCACRIQMRVIPGSAGTIDGNTFVASNREADAIVRVQAGSLQTDVPVRVTNDVARAQILPLHPVAAEDSNLQISVLAYDARGYPIAIPEQLPWTARDGSIDGYGHFHAAHDDAQVQVRLGDRVAEEKITVGRHDEDIALERDATFSSAPHDQPGSIQKNVPCNGCLALAYDFSGTERAAYANASLTLPQTALGLSADVYGDGNHEVLRVAVNNAINERFLYTIATIDWHGWRHVEMDFPPALPQPIVLKSFYVINRVGPGQAVTSSGQIALRSVRVVLAGRGNESPK